MSGCGAMTGFAIIDGELIRKVNRCISVGVDVLPVLKSCAGSYQNEYQHIQPKVNTSYRAAFASNFKRHIATLYPNENVERLDSGKINAHALHIAYLRGTEYKTHWVEDFHIGRVSSLSPIFDLRLYLSLERSSSFSLESL